MQDNIVRHRDAVRYNQVIAEAAEGLLEELESEEIIKWVTGVARQHRFHENRHRSALAKLEQKQEQQEQTDTPAEEKSIQEQQAEFAAEQENAEAQA